MHRALARSVGRVQIEANAMENSFKCWTPERTNAQFPSFEVDIASVPCAVFQVKTGPDRVGRLTKTKLK